MSNELYMIVEGRKVDAPLHDEILDNNDAEKAMSKRAIARAKKRGMSTKTAEKLYGKNPLRCCAVE